MQKIKFPGIIFCVLLIITANNSYSFSIKPLAKPVQSELLKNYRLSQFADLSAKQFSDLTGKKMSLWDRISFGIAKAKMKHELKSNPDLTLKEYTEDKPKRRLGAGWLILIGAAGALLLLLIIFMISYGGQK